MAIGTSRFKIAVIGHTGRGDYGHGIDTVWLHMPECRIVGVADPDEAGQVAAMNRLHAPVGYADWRQLLDETKPDIVAICPRWVDQHHEMVMGAAERGIHVYIEKPLCRTLEEADQLVEVIERHRVKLAIAFPTRYSPVVTRIRRMLEDGAIGELLEMRGRGKEDRRGGAEDLWVLGSHLANIMHYLAGQPNWCFAQVMSDGHRTTRADVHDGNEGFGPLAGDAIQAMYGWASGLTGYLASLRNQKSSSRSRFGLHLMGSAGIIKVSSGYLPVAYYLPDPSWRPGDSGVMEVPISSAGPGEPEPIVVPAGRSATDLGNQAACQDLLEAIEQDRQPEANIYEARAAVEMIVATFESHRCLAPVELPLKTRVNPLTRL